MNSGPTIDYDALQQDAMRGLVRTVLVEAAKSGLPGEHHFYISFNTRAPGVVMSRRLKEKYPREMTIVLQHRFWGLSVSEDRFEVNLTFDGIPERLVIPFMAIRVFVDPSVRFGLQFEIADIGPEPNASTAHMAAADAAVGEQRSSESGSNRTTTTARKPRAPRKPRSADAAADKPNDAGAAAGLQQDTRPASRVSSLAAKSADAANPAPGDAAKQDQASDGAPAAKVVSLDAFRKR